MKQPFEIFCWAAESDQSFLSKLITQLIPKQQRGIITLWDKSCISPGQNADEEIRLHLASARIFLLLIGPDFLANEYCYNVILRAALAKHANREAVTVPVIVRPANWQDVRVLSHIQVLPRNGQPISTQPDQENALWEVTKEIEITVQVLSGEPRVRPNSGFGTGSYGEMFSPSTGGGLNRGGIHTGQPSLVTRQPMTDIGKIPSSQGNKGKKLFAICVLITAVIILGGGTFLVFSNNASSAGSPNRSNVISTHGSSTNSVTTPGTQKTSAAASLSSPQLPLTLHCVNCPYPQLSVTLNRIDIDAPAQSTRWVFAIANNGQNPCSGLSFDPIQLTDIRGNNYEGQGQGASSNQFAIDIGQSVQETAVFVVFPASGTQYTLQVIIYLRGCNIPNFIGTPNTYQTENFTFA